MQTLDDRDKRIENELKEAGVTSKGSAKYAVKYLRKIIGADEHIMAAVYGRYSTGSGFLNLSSGMLAATNKRVIFLDHKPGFTNIDELSYGVVAGVKVTSAGLFSTLVLHTRMGDYTIRYASPSCIGRFREYIEFRIQSNNGVMVN